MGKNTDKLFITHSEWSGPDKHSSSGGVTTRKNSAIPRRLPFTYCALSLQPFETASCDAHGNIFDRSGKNPVTNEAMTADDLIPLNFHKNEDGQYIDPVSHKVFTTSTHIVAIRKSGNVFSWDTIDRLNIAAKNWTDLVCGEDFTRQDLITLQDPMNVVNESAKMKSDAKQSLKRPAPDRLESSTKKSEMSYKASALTTGRAAVALTSTAATPYTKNDRVILSDEEYMLKPRRVKERAYVLMRTNVGDLNIELFTEYAPRTVYNFLKLAEKGYYNGVRFHRNIKHFMIQGGDPTGTGRGGESYWDKPFADEFNSPMSHDARGILSMANKGKNTNTSQFFILYRPKPQLDKKHTIFGRVVDGLDVLDRMEAVPSDTDDKPLKTLVINSILIVTDPFKEFMEKLKEQDGNHQDDSPAGKLKDLDERMTWSGKLIDPSGRGSAAPAKRVVGKYMAR